MRAERIWQRARDVSAEALRLGALVPLTTRLLSLPSVEPFVVRELLGAPPRHLRESGPRPNPFLPWDRPLEVETLETGHVVLLNKYPVQPCHLLVITQDWQPQSGRLGEQDWRAVATVSADTGGLWFFNSGTIAGASQPHRHLQLLPRAPGERSCPLSDLFAEQLSCRRPGWQWAYRLSPRSDPHGGSDLPGLYAQHCSELDIDAVQGGGMTSVDELSAHNLLFDDQWFLTVRRSREHCAGFSVNGLGFAGYLLSTEDSDPQWLVKHGPWRLLAAVAEPGV